MSSFIQRIKLSLCYIAKTAGKWTATVYAVAGLVSLFVSFEGLFPDNATFWRKFWISLVILAGIWFMCAVINAIRVGRKSKKKVVDGYNGKNVYVVYDDIFNPEIVNNSKRYICFAVNRCFDTIVDDKLISSETIHGMAFKNLYEHFGYTPASLDTAIQAAIPDNVSSIILKKEEKPAGNLKRYDVGTYVNLKISDNLNYILLGVSTFDSNLNPHTSLQEYVLAIQKMIESFDKEAQGFPVLLPIIGSGRAHTDLQERDIGVYD